MSKIFKIALTVAMLTFASTSFAQNSTAVDSLAATISDLTKRNAELSKQNSDLTKQNADLQAKVKSCSTNPVVTKDNYSNVYQQMQTISNNGGCFTAGTLISTPSGLRKIEEIRSGDSVLAYDFATQKITARLVEESFVRNDKPYIKVRFSDGTVVEATPDHPFYLPSKGHFEIAQKLIEGDLVAKANNSNLNKNSLYVTKIEDGGIATVYNFRVNKDHNYFANGILVHNTWGFTGKGEEIENDDDIKNPSVDAGLSPTPRRERKTKHTTVK